ncbi:hypothetical protein Dimus_022635, partial [Dionaea muscipula]
GERHRCGTAAHGCRCWSAIVVAVRLLLVGAIVAAVSYSQSRRSMEHGGCHYWRSFDGIGRFWAMSQARRRQTRGASTSPSALDVGVGGR